MPSKTDALIERISKSKAETVFVVCCNRHCMRFMKDQLMSKLPNARLKRFDEIITSPEQRIRIVSRFMVEYDGLHGILNYELFTCHD